MAGCSNLSQAVVSSRKFTTRTGLPLNVVEVEGDVIRELLKFDFYFLSKCWLYVPDDGIDMRLHNESVTRVHMPIVLNARTLNCTTNWRLRKYHDRGHPVLVDAATTTAHTRQKNWLK